MSPATIVRLGAPRPLAPASPAPPRAAPVDAIDDVEAARARDLLLAHALSPSALLGLNAATRRFVSPGRAGPAGAAPEGVVCFRARGRWRFTLGGPAAPDGARAPLLRAFLADARALGHRAALLDLTEAERPLARSLGLGLNVLGRTFGLELDAFGLRGTRFVQLRNKLSRARRAGVEVHELGPDLPRDAAAWRELHALTGAWVAGKGGRLLGFLNGELGEPAQGWRRVLVARQGGRTVGFVTLLPLPARAGPGWLLDLTRRAPDAPPGTSELLALRALERVRGEGARVLSFGLTPCVGLEAEDALPRPALGGSRVVRLLQGLLAEHGAAVYPARGQAAWKEKWGPQRLEPSWLALDGPWRPGCTWQLLRLTGAL